MSPQSSPSLLPLTAAQLGIWNAQQLDPTSPYYVVGEVLQLRGGPTGQPGAGPGVDTAALAEAVRLTVDEAETLRLRFTDGADGPRQYVDPAPASPPEVVDLSGAPDPRLTAEAIIDAEKAACGERWRTMTDGPLFRYLVLDLGAGHNGQPGEVWCIQLYHHIIVDGYSAALLTRRTAAHYTALTGGKPARRNRFATIAEIVDADRAYREGPDHAADRDFWRAQMYPLPDTTGREDLVHGAGTASITTSVRLGASEVADLQARAERRGLVWSDIVVAAYAAWLRKLGIAGRCGTGGGNSGGDCEALIAMPMMARTSGALRRTPAMLVNMLPLRFPVDADATVTDLAGVARGALDAARGHQRFPGSELARELGTPAVLHGVGLNLKTFDVGLDFHGIPGVLRNVAGGPPEDLVLVVTPTSDGGVDLAFETDPQSVDAATARRRLEDIRALLTAEGPLHGIRLRTPQERDTAARERAGAPLPDDYPDLDDLVDSLAYGTGRLVGGTAPDLAGPALATRIGEFAGLVTGRSRTDDVIALDLPKGPDLAAALLGVWRSHRVAVVLDRDHPQARRDQILADSGAVAVLDEDGVRPVPAPGSGAPVPEGLAYLLYTSGTTGTPKGVRVPRTAVEALLAGHHTTLYPDAWSRARGTGLHVAHTASFSFDAAIDQLSWVFTGATVHLYPTDTVGDPASMRAALIDDGIDVLDATPSLAGALIDAGVLDESPVSTVVLGGEAVPRSLWDRLAQASGPSFAAWNVYGPTETTVDALSARVTAGPVTIGTPVPGMTAEILDADGETVPDNETGELYLSGPQVALGYHGRPDQTAAAFDSTGGTRRYRTGDLVTWVPSPHGTGRGAHHFRGRADEQLEIRGHRVEPAEVEAALLTLPRVTGAAVATVGDPGALRLVAHVTTDSGTGSGSVTGAALRTELAALVPGHLVPTRVLVHDRLPLTVGGKVDRTALAALAAEPPHPAEKPNAAGAPGRRPVTDAEQALADVVADVLGAPDTTTVDLGRDFIALGGDSIGALTAAGRLRRSGWAIQAKDLLTGVDLCDVAAGATRVAATGYLSTTSAGTTPDTDTDPDQTLRYATGAVPTGTVTGPRPTYLGHLGVPGDAAPEAAAVAHAVTTLMNTHGALRSVLDESDRTDRANPRFIVPRVPLVPAESIIAPATVTDDELTASLDPTAGVVWRIAVSTATDRHDHGATVRVAVDAGVTDAASAARILDDLSEIFTGALADDLPGRSQPRDRTAAGTGRSWRSGAPAPRHVTSTPARTRRAPLPGGPDTLTRLVALYSATAEDAAVAIALLATGGPVDLITRGRRGPSGTTSTTPVGALSSVRHVPALPGGAPASARTALLHAKEHRARADAATTTGGTGSTGTDGDVEGGATPPPALTVTCGDTRMVPHGHAAACPLLTVGDTGLALTTAAATGDGDSDGVGDRAGDAAGGSDALLHRITDAATALAVLSLSTDGGASPSDLHIDGVDGVGGVSQATIDTWEQHHGPLADVLPLSPLQEGMLYHCLRGGDGYVLAAGVDLRGDVDPERLHAALHDVLTRHDLLRARFDSTTCDAPVQLIPRSVTLPWRTVDLRELPRHAAVTAADDLLRQAAARSVDPGTGPLVTATLVLLPDEAGPAPTARLVLGSHHLLTDGWSTPVMLRDLLAIYHDEPLPPVTPYSDYLRWLAGRDPRDADDAWRSRLDGLDQGTVVAALAPPAAHDAAPDAVGGESVQEIAPDAAAGLLRRARQDGVTPNTVLQAAWTLTLAALTGREDVVFGTTVSGRPTELEGIENTVGLFINTLPSRVRLHRADPLTDLLTGIRRAQAEMTTHASTPLVHVEQLAGVGPLFDTLVVYDNFPPLDDPTGGDDPARLAVAGVHSAGTTDIPLSVVVPPGDTPRILLAHQQALVDPAFVERAARILTEVLTHLSDGPATTVGELLDAVAATTPPWRPTQVAPTGTDGAGAVAGASGDAADTAPDTGVDSGAGATAATIAGVMADLLGRGEVDVHDNFFDIGGHSLLAMRLLGKLRRVRAHGLEAVTIQDIVETGSPAALAARLAPGAPDAPDDVHGSDTPDVSPRQDVLPLAAGTGAPLVCVHPAGGLALPFRGLATHLSAADEGGIPVTGLQLPGALPQVDDVSGLAARYVDTVLRVHPQGPYRLLGYSFGGVVAQAMAAELIRRGHTVTYLGIMDAYPAGEVPRRVAVPDADRGTDRGTDPAVGLTADELRALTGTDADAGLLTRNLQFCDRLLRTATPVDMSGFSGKAQVFIATRADSRLAEPAGPASHPAWAPAPAWRATLPHEPDVLFLPTTHAGLAGDDGWARIAPVIHSALTSTEESQP